MLSTYEPPRADIQARLSRFALCIASSTDEAFNALEQVGQASDDEAKPGLQSAFKQVVSRLDVAKNSAAPSPGDPPRSLIARYSCLPYHQRVAFALVVIEEFSPRQAAAIMELAEDEVRNLLLAVRDFLFTSQWSEKSDA